MLSQTGFAWPAAPPKWRVLDVVYLVLDILVVIGIFAKWRIGPIAFYLAAISQIILYTIFRDWILAVPEEFAVSEAQRSYLTTLVYFHLITLVLVTGALMVQSRNSR